MPSVSKKRPPIVGLDSDKLGMLAGAVLATAVMIICFFRGVPGGEVLWRVAITFVVTYAVTFVMVFVVLHTILGELVAAKRRDRAAARSEEEEEEDGEGMGEVE